MYTTTNTYIYIQFFNTVYICTIYNNMCIYTYVKMIYNSNNIYIYITFSNTYIYIHTYYF